MRISLLSVIIIFSSLFAQAQGSATWLSTSHHFGSFHEEVGNMSHTFKMVNTGDSTLRITNVRATCGCTATQHTTAPIAPGDTATVTVTYNPVGRPGQFNKTVYVFTDGTPHKSALTIVGNVIAAPATIRSQFPVNIGALQLNRNIVPFGDITKGRTRTQFINVYNSSNDTLQVIFSNVPSHIKVEMIPPVIAPGSTATITLAYDSQKVGTWGLSQHNFTIGTLPATSTAKIDITAYINENFGTLTQEQRKKAPVAEISTERINLGAIPASDSIATASFQITNSGKSSLLIRRIYTLDPAITITAKKKKLKPGKSVTVNITAHTPQLGNIINSKLIIITNDPASPQQPVRIVGTIDK